jgi:hypothetical protein
MAQRRGTGLRLSREVGFEPRRDGQDALTGAYLRLLPACSRPVCSASRVWLGEEACDAVSDTLDAGTARGPGPGGDLRQGVLGSAGRAAHH